MRVLRPGQVPRRRRPRPTTVAAFALVPVLLVAFWIPFDEYVRNYLDVYSSRGRLVRTVEGRRDLRAILLAVPRTYLGRPDAPSVPRLEMDIKFKHLKRLRDKRAEARELGVLFSNDDDYVPARITVDGRTVRVKVRLKGDLADHFRGRRWSMRVKTRGGDAMFGMRRFSLQAPHTRGFQTEPLFLEFLKSQGVLVPRYSFVDLVINGERIGLTAMEEHFSKELLESQERREGVILKYDEDPFWRAWLLPGRTVADFDNWRNAMITAFGPTRIAKTPRLAAQYALGTGLLRGVMEDRLRPAAAFDPALWGRFYAACELFTAGHMAVWHNLRMYLNPVTGLLEPIGFDSNMNHHWGETDLFDCQEGRQHITMTGAILSDPELRAAFVESLQAFRALVSSEAFERDWREREARYLAILRRDFPWLREFDFELLRERVEQLGGVTLETYDDYVRAREPRDFEYAPGAVLPRVVYAELRTDAAGPHVVLSNAVSKPVVVRDLRFAPPELEREHSFAAGMSPGLPIRLDASHWPEVPRSARVEFEAPVREEAWSIEGVARMDGGDHEYAFEVRAGHPARTAPAIPRTTLRDALARHPFLKVVERGEEPAVLRVEPGAWNVEGSLILPDRHDLEIGPGTTLRFSADAGLVARGGLRFQGTPAAPVVLEARAAEDGAATWLGLAAIGDGASHDWAHVRVRNTSGVRFGSWELTGGTTLARGDVQMRDVVFEGTQAEDALNLIRSDFTLEDVSVLHTRSDAFDCDFCTGSIRGGTLRDIGGDGVDVSGSEVEIQGTIIRDVRDKAISVGEGSRLEARRVSVQDCGTGFASKDGSHGVVGDSTFERIAHVALMAYVKKPEYDGASIDADGLSIEDVSRTAIAQIGSRLSLDGQPVEPIEIDVDALYREGYMKK